MLGFVSNSKQVDPYALTVHFAEVTGGGGPSRHVAPAMQDRIPLFGALLRRYRLEAGLSQDTLAERSQMSVETIGALERGVRRWPYRETVELLASALKLDSRGKGELEAAAIRPQRHHSRSTAGLVPVPDLSAVDEKAAAHLHNLPAELSSLIGADDSVKQISELVTAFRLVTLTGSAGCGKTRAALRVAQNLIGTRPDGIWLVELAPLSARSAGVESTTYALARALGIENAAGHTMLESIVSALRRKNALLVLDNCEHVIAETRDIAVAILRACKSVSILATSREALSIAGERTYRVPSLAYPEEPDMLASEAMSFPAIKLFADRAKGADFAFALNDHNASTIARICKRLDGLPLAIELAAGQVRILNPVRIFEMLDQPCGMLTGEDRSASPRLQTMRGAIDWSFALLNEDERLLARRLSIFSDGWTLEAAEATCSDAPLQVHQVFGLLRSLVDKSLVTVISIGADKRFRFLESIRAFAREHLTAAEHERIARRHAEWAANFGEEAAHRVFHTRDGILYSTFEGSNRREALEWALGDGGDTLLAGRVAGSLPWRPGYLYLPLVDDQSTKELTETALSRIRHTPYRTIEARLLLLVGYASRGARAVEIFQRSIDLFDEANERSHWLGHTLLAFTSALQGVGDYQRGLAASERLFNLIDELSARRTWAHGVALRLRAVHLVGLDLYDEARYCLLELSSQIDNYSHLDVLARTSLAELECKLGNHREAIRIVDDLISYPYFSSSAFPGPVLTITLCKASAFRIIIGDIEQAVQSALEALRLTRLRSSLQSTRQRTDAIQHIAAAAALSGEGEAAARLLGYVDAWYLTRGQIRWHTEQLTYEIAESNLRDLVEITRREKMLESGSRLDEDAAVDLAYAVGKSIVSTTARGGIPPFE